MAAPKTVVTYALNGTTREFDFSFDYLSRSFVQITLIGETRKQLVLGTDFTFTSNTRIRTNLIWGPPSWTLIEIRRVTSTTERLVDFQDASILRAADLNLSELQVLHVAEEAREAATETIGTNNGGNLDARGRRIVNVLDPVDPLDVVNRQWYEADVNGVYQNRIAAEQARDKAREWATSPNQVELDLESSKTYAARSKESETAASASATASANSAASSSSSAMAASASAGSALNQAVVAEGHANAASVSASSASSSASAASSYAASSLTQANRAKDEADRAETNATLVDTAFLRNRANHLGKQPPSTVTGLAEYLSTPSGFRNKIINGCMRVSQRAARAITASPQYGKADRFIAYISGGTGITGNIDQSADAAFKSGYRMWLSSLSYTSGIWAIQHRIESLNTIDLNGKTVTVSFKVWHDFGSSRPLKVSLAKANVVDNFSAATLIGSVYTSPAIATGTYTTVTCSFTLGSTDASNGLLLQINDASATTVSAKNVVIGDVQLEVGEVATPFDSRPYGTELALCQRYYFSGAILMAYMYISNLSYRNSALVLPVTMRATPTFSATGSLGSLYASSSTTNTVTVTYQGVPDSDAMAITFSNISAEL